MSALGVRWAKPGAIRPAPSGPRRKACAVEFLLLIPVFGVLAQIWVTWSRRTRRAPGVEDTMAAHQRALAAMAAPSSVREG